MALSQADRIQALARDNAEIGINRASLFVGRGFSDRVIRALIAYGIELPEEVLSMDEAELRRIKGIGREALAELTAYRKRFRGEAL